MRGTRIPNQPESVVQGCPVAVGDRLRRSNFSNPGTIQAIEWSVTFETWCFHLLFPDGKLVWVYGHEPGLNCMNGRSYPRPPIVPSDPVSISE